MDTVELIEPEGKIVILGEIPIERAKPEVGIAALGETPVEGATAEITLAWLPSCAKVGIELNFWLDFKNTSSETISIRPHIYLIGLIDHIFSTRELKPGQSYHEISPLGLPWVGGVFAYEDFDRVEGAIDVYTPEGWAEADRVAGEPFMWWDTFPLPEITITSAPESVPANTDGKIYCALYNPGFTNPPGGFLMINGFRSPSAGYYAISPNQSLSFIFRFTMGDQDRTITITPYRAHPEGQPDIAGEPVSVTVKKGVAAMGCAPLVAAGILLIVGIITAIILLV